MPRKCLWAQYRRDAPVGTQLTRLRYAEDTFYSILDIDLDLRLRFFVTAECILLLDIGNTRLKWNVCQRGSMVLLTETRGFQYSLEMLSRQLAEIFGQFSPAFVAEAHIGNIKRALVSNVAGQAVESRVREYLQNRMGIVVEIVKPAVNKLGMTNGYAHPEQLGVDRWVAMIGARTYRLPQAMCVVDCGTAITIDFVMPDGEHLGGLITASEATITSKVAQKTADIKTQGEINAELTPFAKSTEQALANGASYSVAGCIRTAVDQASEMLGTDVQIILTGGAVNQVRSLLPINVLYDEDLIMKGLVVLANN